MRRLGQAQERHFRSLCDLPTSLTNPVGDCTTGHKMLVELSDCLVPYSTSKVSSRKVMMVYSHYCGLVSSRLLYK